MIVYLPAGTWYIERLQSENEKPSENQHRAYAQRDGYSKTSRQSTLQIITVRLIIRSTIFYPVKKTNSEYFQV